MKNIFHSKYTVPCVRALDMVLTSQGDFGFWIFNHHFGTILSIKDKDSIKEN